MVALLKKTYCGRLRISQCQLEGIQLSTKFDWYQVLYIAKKSNYFWSILLNGMMLLILDRYLPRLYQFHWTSGSSLYPDPRHMFPRIPRGSSPHEVQLVTTSLQIALIPCRLPYPIPCSCRINSQTSRDCTRGSWSPICDTETDIIVPHSPASFPSRKCNNSTRFCNTILQFDLGAPW